MSYIITRLDQKNRTPKAKQYSRWLAWRKTRSNQIALQDFMPICTLNYNGQRDDFGRFLPGITHPMKTKELREKSRNSHQGQKPWNTGKSGTYHLSKETVEKMCIVQKARPKHPNSINALRLLAIKNKGVPLSIDHRHKLVIARRHRVFPFKDTKPERIMQIALSLNGIKFQKHKPIVGQPDIFIEPNICIFIDGDYWHANPTKYVAEQILFRNTMAYEIWSKDRKINSELNALGYKVIRFWESNIKNDAQKCIELIKWS